MCNYGEVFGPGCYFTADGSFAPVDGATRCPKDFTVAIEQVLGAVGAGGSGGSGQRTQQPCSVRGQRVASGCPSTPPSARSPVHSTVHPPPIEQGGLVVLGRPFISDAISGPGYLRVLYLDEEIRCRVGGD